MFGKSTKSILIFSLLSGIISAQSPEIKPENQPRSVSFGGLRVRSIGPAVMSGRVSDVEGVNNDPAIFYIGAANGGVWKSISGGTSFHAIFDDYPQSIGKIRVDQNHTDTVWVGTGEPWVRNSVSVGTGIYVSRNGGSTWEFKGLPTSERIANIQIDPRDSKTIYVAVQGALWSDSEDRGIYKSTDFGTTWTKILYVNPKTGAADLVIDPSNPDILYAAMWEHRRRPDFFNSGGKGSGLYKTIDAGKNWTKVEGGGLPSGTLGRIGIGMAPSNPKTMYLSIECEKQNEKGIYKTTDAGKTWVRTNGDFNTTVRPFYFSRIVVDPTNENKLVKAGLQGVISEDGGNTFRVIGSGVHSDMHAFYIHPKNPKNIILGCDGGVFISADGGYLWKQCMDLPLAQFYQVAVDNEEPYNVYGGLQDNGSWYAPNETGGGVKNQDWTFASGGDGFYVFPSPTDKNIVFSESQGGDFVRSNKKDGTQSDIKPMAKVGEPEYRWNWNTPIAVSPNNPNKMYYSCQFLFKTYNAGDSWTKISPDLTTNDPKRQDKKTGGLSSDWSGAETNTTIVQIAESPQDSNIIWCGTDDGNVQITSDGGKVWTNVIDKIGAPKGLWVSHLEPSHYDRNTCYVTIDGHRNGDRKPYAYKTTDLGKTWSSLNIDGVDAYAHCLTEDIVNKELLFLGTEFGLFISIDGGKSFKRFTNNIPKTAIMKMVIQPKESDLVIATHGRGIFIFDDLTALRALTKEIQDKDFHLFATKPKIYQLRKTGGWFGGAGNFQGEDPSDDVQIVYYQKKRHTFGEMKIELFDPSGKFMKELPAGKSAGINVVNIATILPMPKAAPTTNIEAMGRGAFPPSLPEGTYSYKITKGTNVYNGNFLIKYPDNCPYPIADRKQQQDLSLKVYDLVNQLGYVFYQNKSIGEQAGSVAKSIENSDKKLAKLLTDLSTDVQKYNASITTLDGDFYIAAGEHLREELSRCYSGVVGYPGKVSDTQMERMKYFEGEIAKVNKQFAEYTTRMNTLNTALNKIGKQALTIKTYPTFLEGK